MKCSINIANVYQIGVIRKKDNLYWEEQKLGQNNNTLKSFYSMYQNY